MSDEIGRDAMAKMIMVTRRTQQQKEVSVTMTSGKFGKNEIIIHASGLKPEFDPSVVVMEAALAMSLMEQKNPTVIADIKAAGQLEDKKQKSKLDEKIAEMKQ